MAYLMKFKQKTPSIVGAESDGSGDPTKRYFEKNKVYEIMPNDAVHFHDAGLATFVPNPKKGK